MKIQRLLSDIIKSHFGKDHLMLIGDLDKEHVAVAINEFAAYVLPKDDFVLDREMLLAGRKEFGVKKIFEKVDISEPARWTGDVNVEGKREALKIANLNTHAWANRKLLKYFDEPVDYRITGPKDPIYAYEGETLVGVVFPLNIKEEK